MSDKSITLSADTLNSIKEALGCQLSPKVIEVETENSPMLGKVCVVRTYSAGVHIGTLAAKTGRNVLLTDAVRLWKWTDAFSLSEVATQGVGEDSRISEAVEMIELTEAVELIPATEKAQGTFGTRNN